MESNQRIKAYHRRKLACSFVSTCLFALYALLWCTSALTVVDSFSQTIANRWLLLFGFGLLFGAVYELLTLPLAYYSSYLLEHRFDLSTETLGHWIKNQLKTWVVGGVLGAIVLAGMYGLLWYGGQLWYLWTLIAWLALVVVLAQIFPVIILPIFYKATPVSDESLVERLTRLAQGTGITIRGVFDLDLSQETKKANAMLAGLGRTRRVFLSDTLLEAFKPDEVAVVFAHELAHHVRKHIWKGLAMTALLSVAMVALVVWRLGPHRGTDANAVVAGIAGLPQVLLAITLLEMLIVPIINAVQRHFEVQADTDALSSTQNPPAYVSAFERLGRMNLADPSPHPLVEWYFYDHPALEKRIALADRFKASAGAGQA